MDFNKDKEKNTKKLYTEQELNAELEKRLNEAKAGWDKENAEKIRIHERGRKSARRNGKETEGI